jgi:hypothetical protein
MPLAPQGDRRASGAPVATRTVNPRLPLRRPRMPSPSPTLPTEGPPLAGSGRSRRRRAAGVVAMCLAIVATAAAWSAPAPTDAATNYLLMPRSELLARPTSGTAWSAMKSVADAGLGTASLCNQDEDHHLRTLAAALVYARTGTSSYKTKATTGIMTAIKTQTVGCSNATLALGRQLAAYVLAADFIDLAGTNDSTFRSFLTGIRKKDIGGHSVWDSLEDTHRFSANNWGAHAGASRIAASLYLGDTADVSIATRVARGFLGDRAQYAGFTHKLSSTDLSWACGTASTYTPVNPDCTKSGIDVDGAIVADISRAGSLTWPPGSTAISYQVDTIAAVGLQLELLYRSGYTGAWDWSSSALKRAAELVQRSAASGGDGWNETNASSQIPWLLNVRYGTFLPTRSVAMGRGIGFASWLWGSGVGTTTPPPSPGPAPVTSTPWVRLSTTSTATTYGVPVVIGWGLASTSAGLSRYQLQVQRDGGAWSTASLTSSTATTHRLTLGLGSEYLVRVRAIDRAGQVGSWTTSAPVAGLRADDASSSLRWSGSWTTRSASGFIGGKAHRSHIRDSSVTYTFRGTSIAWFGAKSTDMGKAWVDIDGKYVTTVDLYASSSRTRRIVFAATLPDGEHTIRIRVVGTSGRPYVYVDGFYSIDPD